jgi:hypothetical protein
LRRQGFSAVFALLVLAGSSPAETLTGTVLDPQQHLVAGAIVSLHCQGKTETRQTDHQGHFTFTREAFPDDCTVTAASSGFARQDWPLGGDRVLALQLRLAEIKQTVSVPADILSALPLASVSLSASDLKEISDNTIDLVAYAKRMAGVQSGSDHIYVDGLPTDTLPPAGTIDRITINADPFSAEYSDGSGTHIDILTKDTERKFKLDVGGLSFGPGTHSALNSHLDSTSETGRGMVTGPVPYLPLAFTANGDFNYQQSEEPIEAVVPSIPGHPMAAVASAPTTAFNHSVTLGVYYARNDTLHANASLSLSGLAHSNVGVFGLTLPDAGMSEDLASREFRATVTRTGLRSVYRGGLLIHCSDTTLRANSGGLGVSVLGAFVAGGADIDHQAADSERWTLKNVLTEELHGHVLTFGITSSRTGDGKSEFPNASGRIEFDNLDQYMLSATTGAGTGTWFLTQGQGHAHHVSYNAAPFVESELLRSKNAAVRGGFRADYQTNGGVQYSPRLSSAAGLRGFRFRTGTGMFVQNWPNWVFLNVVENDGHHLQQYLATDVSLSAVQAGAPALNLPTIVSQTEPNLTPPREWISKASVEHPYKHFTPGVEYTWIVGTHLLGSQRLSVPAGWTDILESNRTSRQHQLHFRGQYEIKGQNFSAHYEWMHARDDSDGPFSFPARQNNLRNEWGPASNVAPHNVTLIGQFRRKATTVTLMEVLRSAVPLSITSGLDPEGNGLYTDRAGRTRNSGDGPAFRSLTLYAHRRFSLSRFSSGSTRRVSFDGGLQVENLLDNKNYLTMGTIIGSPLFGQPLAALPGRALRFSLNLARP